MSGFKKTITFDAENQEEADAISAALEATLKAHDVHVIETLPAMPHAAPERQSLYTDGGCERAGGIGAWAFILEQPDGTSEERYGGDFETTNNRMELMAVIKGLEACFVGPRIVCFSDSRYVIDGITKWVKKWAVNGWVTSSFTPVANKDLWLELLKLVAVHDVGFQHVKGHSGHPQNERCDALCTKVMINVAAQLLDED